MGWELFTSHIPLYSIRSSHLVSPSPSPPPQITYLILHPLYKLTFLYNLSALSPTHTPLPHVHLHSIPSSHPQFPLSSLSTSYNFSLSVPHSSSSLPTYILFTIDKEKCPCYCTVAHCLCTCCGVGGLHVAALNNLGAALPCDYQHPSASLLYTRRRMVECRGAASACTPPYHLQMSLQQ